MTALPRKYAALANEPGPLLLIEALKEHGVLELKGSGNNPTIVRWADEVAAATPTAYTRWASDWYNDDSIPWCGLFMAVITVRSSTRANVRVPPPKYLSAKDWLNFGVPITEGKAMLGDVLVFDRNGGGHVALYVGEDATAYHILGGNQSDAVTITRKAKKEWVGTRRPHYNRQPANVRQVQYGTDGPLSTNEA